jgi:hypothetical protein
MSDGICSVDGCDKPRHGRGLCNAHYRRQHRTGEFGKRMSALHRFMAKVALPDDPDDCWLWTAGQRDDGYGSFWMMGRDRRAHQVAYELFVGPIPGGLLVDHTCFTPLCVNPRHLRVATNKQNLENLSGPTRRSKSGVRGVRRSKRGTRWEVDVRHHGMNHFGGSFTDLREAEAAAIALRNQLFTHNDVDRRIGA